jgi:uncharacterized membrane protein
MKPIVAALCFLMSISLNGCTQSPPGAGAPEAAHFRISNVPPGAIVIRQGETKAVHLKLERGQGFNAAVTLKAEHPDGIEIVFSDSALASTDRSEFYVKISVGNNAAPGDHMIRVTATPDAGAPTVLDIPMLIKARADNVKLELKGPAALVNIKRGETQTVKIAIEPAAKYTATLKLKATGPSEMLLEWVPTDSLKLADTNEAILQITTGQGAKLGEETIRISGMADAATVIPLDLKTKVVAP